MSKEYHLLVVDDEQDMLLLLESILQKEDFDVTTVTSGEDCSSTSSLK